MLARLVVPSFVLAACLTSAAFAAGVDVGDQAPDFSAVGVDGKTYSLKSLAGSKAVVLCFTCNSCPVAVAYEDRFIDFAKKYDAKGVKFVAINVNPEDLDAMQARAEEKGFNFPYVKDASGNSAKAYGAQVTPHLFLIDKAGKVAYIGAFDDNMNPAKASDHHLIDAVDAVLEGKTPLKTKTRAVGCSIKYKR